MQESYLSYNGKIAIPYTLQRDKVVLLPPQDLITICKTTEIRFLVFEFLGEEVNESEPNTEYG